MSVKTAFTVALLATTALPVLAVADDTYISGAIGLIDPANDTIANSATTFDNGTMGALAIGMGLWDDWRLEGEISRRAAEVDRVGGNAGSGEGLATSLMGNLIYDIKTDTGLTPYLGAGLGVSLGELNGARSYNGAAIDDSDVVPALQGIAGVSYAIDDSLSLFADYRYFLANSIDVSTNTAVSSSYDFKAQSVMIGLRYAFGGPKTTSTSAPVQTVAPAAVVESPAVPEPVDPPRAYLVFFDWDKADLTAESRQIIAAAAANADKMNIVRIELTGHADRSGAAAYNMGLSQRRADAVKAELQRLGLTDEEITTAAKGETDPLVQTPDGVREPQNRRVEIVFP